MSFVNKRSAVASSIVLGCLVLFIIVLFVVRVVDNNSSNAVLSDNVDTTGQNIQSSHQDKESSRQDKVSSNQDKESSRQDKVSSNQDKESSRQDKESSRRDKESSNQDRKSEYDENNDVEDFAGSEETAAVSVETDEFGIPIDRYEIVEGKVKNGEFLSTLLLKLGLSQNTSYNLTEKCKGVFDIRQFRVGNEYKAYYTTDDAHILSYLLYEKDSKSFIVFSTIEDSLSVKEVQKEIKREMKYVEVTIDTSLWQDVLDAGTTPNLAIKLSDIYAWTIDFFGLQKGDSFKAYYTELSYQDKVLDVDEVLYCSFQSSGREYVTYYFEEEGTSNTYWNEKGESMRKAFLKSPLNFRRISSGFTYSRRHPITRVVRPHTGIDYAAPMGTPVWSIGDGVVVKKGYSGGGGKTVKIKHNSVYTSAYMHLSNYGKGIKVGTRVRQGQVIGYVGSTGSSTGPHLDFRIWKNGSPINPLKMDSPPATPISKGNMERYKEQIRFVQSSVNKKLAVKLLKEKMADLHI